MKRVFCVDLDNKYEEIYKQLLNSNPDWVVQYKIVELGFESLLDMKKRKVI